MGIGMVLVVDKHIAQSVLKNKAIKAFQPEIIGYIVKGSAKVQMQY
jgi:phosphoribosylaminoimidazole (AIR) synthetase